MTSNIAISAKSCFSIDTNKVLLLLQVMYCRRMKARNTTNTSTTYSGFRLLFAAVCHFEFYKNNVISNNII